MSFLTIMIPTIDSRIEKLTRLIAELHAQIHRCPIKGWDIKIDILTNYQDASIGFRRNMLLQRADSKYVCFFDDDDMPTEHFMSSLAKGILQGYDCCSLTGIYTVNGQNPEIFEHSIKYNLWKTNEGAVYPNVKYERPPNHLNCIKSEIAKKISFKDMNHGEDNAWSDSLRDSGLIKSEFYIQEPIYQYLKVQ